MIASIELASTAMGSAGPAMPGGRALAVAALLSWLVAELFGAWMLRSWINAGGAGRRRSRGGGASPPVVFSHAGLALAGLTTWVIFLASRSPAAAWIAIGFLAPAIGLGVSTVTTWTPYPVRRPPDPGEPVHPAPVPQGDAALRRALASEALTSQLIDDMLARMLAEPDGAIRRRWRLAALVPVVHGIAALTTFLLAVLAAVAAVGT